MHAQISPQHSGAFRESALSSSMRLPAYSRVVSTVSAFGPIGLFLQLALVACLCTRGVKCVRSADRSQMSCLVTIFYSLLYLVASPTAIMVNKILMKVRTRAT